MVNAKKQNPSDVPERRRGRPAGKNRVPLSLDERRARNAHYERERRNQTADAMIELATAVGCDPNVANADVLATAISQIHRSTSEPIEDLLRINSNLQSQIDMLCERLGISADSVELQDDEDEEFVPIAQPSNSPSTSNDCDHSNSSNRQAIKRKRLTSTNHQHKEKRIKTKSTTSVDSGVGSTQSPSVSPTELCVEYQPYVDLQTELYNDLLRSAGISSVQPVSYVQDNDNASLSNPVAFPTTDTDVNDVPLNLTDTDINALRNWLQMEFPDFNNDYDDVFSEMQ